MPRTSFNREELEISGYYPGFGPVNPGIPILHTPITPRENLKRFILHDHPLWMPSFWEMKMFNPLVIPDNQARGMVLEAAVVSPEQFGGSDMFGIEWEFVPSVRGSIVRPGNPCLADVSDWRKKIAFPDFSKYDWAGCAERNQGYLDDPRAIQFTVFTGFFERLISFVDMTDALISMIDEDTQDVVKALFERLADMYEELFPLVVKWFHPTLLWFHDDWGSQRAPFFSADTLKELLLPALKRTVAAAHKNGMGFEMHSCGKIEAMVPLMIEAGVDMWNGQDMNDKRTLYREYGRDIALGVCPDPLPKEVTDTIIHDAARRFMDEYPENAYLGMAFTADTRIYTALYEESRRRCSA
ncbi:MAG: hypothetical protein Q4C13_01135 [Clostridia bacterium]|nr:hypothetical protein [Clostridia bacterium]